MLVEAAICDAGTAYGAGPGNGGFNRGRFGSGESLSEQSVSRINAEQKHTCSPFLKHS